MLDALDTYNTKKGKGPWRMGRVFFLFLTIGCLEGTSDVVCVTCAGENRQVCYFNGRSGVNEMFSLECGEVCFGWVSLHFLDTFFSSLTPVRFLFSSSLPSLFWIRM